MYVVTVIKKNLVTNEDETVYQQTVNLEPNIPKLVEAVNSPVLPF